QLDVCFMSVPTSVLRRHDHPRRDRRRLVPVSVDRHARIDSHPSSPPRSRFDLRITWGIGNGHPISPALCLPPQTTGRGTSTCSDPVPLISSVLARCYGAW